MSSNNNEKQEKFALPSIPFLERKTNDLDPFGDQSAVQSGIQRKIKRENNDAAMSTTLSKSFDVLSKEQLRQQAHQLLEKSENETRESNHVQSRHISITNDIDRLVQLKRQLLASDPSHWLHVLLFWIDLQSSADGDNSATITHRTLQDMRNIFRAQCAPENTELTKLQNVLDQLLANLDNSDFDSMQSVMAVLDITGVHFLRQYMLHRNIVVDDAKSADVMTTFLFMATVMRNRLPLVLPGSNTNQNNENTQGHKSEYKRSQGQLMLLQRLLQISTINNH